VKNLFEYILSLEANTSIDYKNFKEEINKKTTEYIQGKFLNEILDSSAEINEKDTIQLKRLVESGIHNMTELRIIKTLVDENYSKDEVEFESDLELQKNELKNIIDYIDQDNKSEAYEILNDFDKRIIVDTEKIAVLTDNLSGADVAAIANTAVSLVIHKHLDKHPTADELKEAAEGARITMFDFEEAVKKVKTQKDLKIGQKIAVPYYR
jgi:hypothetical protein